MDAQELLIADHNRVRGLFARYKQAHGDDDTANATALAAKIVEELEIHTTIEEELYYPAITDVSEEIHEIVVEGLQEHHVANELMDELKTVDPASEEWAAKVQVLMESVEHHLGEEEQKMFPKVRGAVRHSLLVEVGEKLAARKEQMGVPTPPVDLTMEELRHMASDQQIPGRSKMRKEVLAATVDPRG
jgi:iron-sulfur cluster repair protein YtfE (RIC family)